MTDLKTFYHGTSFENWEKIQKEGILFGRRFIEGWKSVEHINEYFDNPDSYKRYVDSKPLPPIQTEKEYEVYQVRDRARTIKEFDPEAPLIREISRCTYLATKIEDTVGWGKSEEVLLEVKYDPNSEGATNNYCEGCWQFRVYDAIPLENVKRTEEVTNVL